MGCRSSGCEGGAQHFSFKTDIDYAGAFGKQSRQGCQHQRRRQAQRLRQEYSVYMLDSSRISVAGVNARNIDYIAESVSRVL